MTPGEPLTPDPPTPGRSGPDLAAPYLAESRWTFSDVLLALLAGIAGAIIAGVAVVSASPDQVGVRELAVTLGAQATATLAVVAGLGASRGSGAWWRDVGIRFRPVYVWGIVAGVGLQLVVALVVGPLLRLLRPDAPRQQIVEVAERASDTAARLTFALLLVVIAPLIEEIVFRGMLLSRLRRAMGPFPAIAVSAAAFAGLHLLDPDALFAVPGLFLIGLALGWVALRTGDIGLAITVHAGVNLTAVLVILFAQDLLDAVEAIIRPLTG